METFFFDLKLSSLNTTALFLFVSTVLPNRHLFTLSLLAFLPIFGYDIFDIGMPMR
jgi:hypothetical protein